VKRLLCCVACINFLLEDTSYTSHQFCQAEFCTYFITWFNSSTARQATRSSKCMYTVERLVVSISSFNSSFITQILTIIFFNHFKLLTLTYQVAKSTKTTTSRAAAPGTAVLLMIMAATGRWRPATFTRLGWTGRRSPTFTRLVRLGLGGLGTRGGRGWGWGRSRSPLLLPMSLWACEQQWKNT